MKHVELYESDDPNKTKGEAMARAITYVFQTLRAYYPKYGMVMKNSDQELAMMGEWGKALVLAKINQEMLKSGIERAKYYAAEDRFCNWPAVSDFIAWCYGLPEPKDAYREAVANCHDMTSWEPSHPAVALVFELINRNEFRLSDERRAWSDYVAAYGKIRAKVLNGEQLQYAKPEPVQRIAHVRTPENVENGKRELRELRAMLGDISAKEQNPNDDIHDMEKLKLEALRKAKAYLEAKKEKGNE